MAQLLLVLHCGLARAVGDTVTRGTPPGPSAALRANQSHIDAYLAEVRRSGIVEECTSEALMPKAVREALAILRKAAVVEEADASDPLGDLIADMFEGEHCASAFGEPQNKEAAAEEEAEAFQKLFEGAHHLMPSVVQSIVINTEHAIDDISDQASSSDTAVGTGAKILTVLIKKVSLIVPSADT